MSVLSQSDFAKEKRSWEPDRDRFLGLALMGRATGGPNSKLPPPGAKGFPSPPALLSFGLLFDLSAVPLPCAVIESDAIAASFQESPRSPRSFLLTRRAAAAAGIEASSTSSRLFRRLGGPPSYSCPVWGWVKRTRERGVDWDRFGGRLREK